MYGRRAFDSAEAARSEVLFGWALNPRAGREHADLESEVREGGGIAESGRSFSASMDAIRRRLLDVMDVDSNAVEVRAWYGVAGVVVDEAGALYYFCRCFYNDIV